MITKSYLGHNFSLQSSFDKAIHNPDFNTVYICDICKCISVYWDRIFYLQSVRYYQAATVSNIENIRLTITCEEQQIKNLVE